MESERSLGPLGGEPLEVQAGRLRLHHEGESRSIGSDDEVLGQSPLQPQAGHAEGPVLIVEMGPHGVVA